MSPVPPTVQPPARSRSLSLLLAPAVWLGLVGCASSAPPCRIIPAQLELAQMKRDKARTAYLTLADDVQRMKSNEEVSLEREASLAKERDDLRAHVDSLEADRNKETGK